MSKPLAKLDGAFELIRTSVDPGWWAVALLIAVMLGGFGWLSGQISRMGTRVDAVSLKVAETPGLFQRELQAQTEKLTPLITTQTGKADGPRRRPTRLGQPRVVLQRPGRE